MGHILFKSGSPSVSLIDFVAPYVALLAALQQSQTRMNPMRKTMLEIFLSLICAGKDSFIGIHTDKRQFIVSTHAKSSHCHN